MTDGSVQLSYREHPAAMHEYVAEAQAGQTVAEILGDGARHTLKVTLGGIELPRAFWPKLRPRMGQRLEITAFPQGGGNNNKLLKLVVIIVAIVATFVTRNPQVGMAILSLGFTAVNLLVPPPQPKQAGAMDPFNTLASLTGTQNQASPYSPIPLVIGTCVFYPPHAALPYTEISGDDQYLRMMLDCGYGDLDVSDIKIGETPIESYDDVEWEVTTTPTLFTQDVYELSVGTVLNNDSDSDTRTGQAGSAEMSVDLQFPNGLYGFNSDGDKIYAGVNVDIAYRKVGTTTWFGIYDQPGLSVSSSAATVDHAMNQITIKNNESKTLRVGIRWKNYTSDQYEVKVTRLGHFGDSGREWFWDMTWTVLRSVDNRPPSNTGTTKLVMRIKATDQLNGMVSTVNVKAVQKIRTYDPSTATWTTGVATGNSAWVYHWLYTTSPGVARHVPDTRMDIDGIVDWAAECTARSYEYNHVESDGRTFFELAQDVLASGRATFGMPNGKYGCVRDVPQTVPVQMFAPANSWNFSGTTQYYDPPHALRCRFINPEANNQEDELVVYASGYDASSATIYEVMDLRVCTNPAAVWSIGAYHLAAAWERTSVYTFNADMEHLIAKRGALVMVAHDVVDWGIASGRIKAINGNRILLDGPVDLDPAKLYGLRVRRFDNTQATSGVTPLITWDCTFVRFDMDADVDDLHGPTRVLVVGDPTMCEVGDLYVLGEANQVAFPAIVQSIKPQNDLVATITVVDQAPDVPLAGTGTPPTFVSQITGKSWCSPPDPPKLTIRLGTSAANDAGIVHNETGITGDVASGIYRMPVTFGGNGRSVAMR
ncbi:host specificity factor TipJ family phage tail protein [Dyella amyloliquefaciens]|uniref:host specificity factor TipJ family phage tail protein n=1 Tax=Dyella amyloliquefaciens TaxID=1770545 RepID=UPI00102E749C|nr:host specificity factor TipJ family phage tail protein [Dyella amyloliquefaciens]